MEKVIRSFISELKRRRVLSTAVLYCMASWVLLEVASVLAPALLLPDWTMRFLVLLVALGFPCALVVSWFFDITLRGIRATDDEAAAPAESSSGIHSPPDIEDAIASVAVIPFDIIGNDAEQKLLSEGLATEIHMELSRLHRVRVASRYASFRCRDRGASLDDIASELNVRYVLSGNLMTSNSGVRIIAELDDATKGTQVWSARYERDMNDVLSVLREISESVVSAFGVQRLKIEMESARNSEPENLAAWSLVQRARGHILEANEHAITAACDLLTRAIEMDSNYAAAHATLAAALSERLLNGFGSTIAEDIRSISSAIERGLELAPQDTFVRKMSGLAWSIIGEPTRAINSLKSVVEVAPYDFGAWGYLGWPLTSRGSTSDIEELKHILDRALRIVPNHPGAAFWFHHLSVANVCVGDHESAVELAKRATDMHSSMSWGWLNYANALGHVNRTDEAGNAVSRALDSNPHMTAEHYARQVELMAEGPGFIEQRTNGLRKSGLLEPQTA